MSSPVDVAPAAMASFTSGSSSGTTSHSVRVVKGLAAAFP
jgi:hypothetical protein